MPQQALALHRILPQVYDLTALRTGSVRDQLLRAAMLVHGLTQPGSAEDPLNPAKAALDKHRSLLVLGGGPAGMTAALCAAQVGVAVQVIEKAPTPFTSLAQARWRRVDPVEYDWPQPHFDRGSFPAPGCSQGLPFEMGRHDGLALSQNWQRVWDDWLHNFDGRDGRGKVLLHPKLSAERFAQHLVQQAPLQTPGALLPVAGPWPGGQASQHFGAVINCVGFERERTHHLRYQLPPPGTPAPATDPWQGHVGPRFWLDNDGLQHHQPLGHRTVLVSGGGDGALQDLQRVLTGDFGLALWQRLTQPANPQHKALAGNDPALLAAVALAEDQGRRAHVWALHSPPEQAMAEWHRRIEQAVTAWLNSHDIDVLDGLADQIFRSEWRRDQARLHWVLQSPQPGHAYALNRVLVLVLQALAQRLPTPVWQVWPEHQVHSMQPMAGGHRCGQPGRCVGHAHRLQINDTSGRVAATLDDATLVIVRHGTIAQSLFGPQPLREQMLAYDWPD